MNRVARSDADPGNFSRHTATRPDPSEIDPFYHPFIDRVPDGDIVETLRGGIERTLPLLEACPAERETFRYEPGKWSVRDLVGHLADSERLYAYRALHFARRDRAPLPGLMSEHWVERSNADSRSLSTLASELEAVRGATVALFDSLGPEDWSATGVASGRSFTVRSIAWMIAGHEIHHREILRERYGLSAPGSRGPDS